MGKAHSQPCISIHANIFHRLRLKLHDLQGNLVAHCTFPNEFIVTANGKEKAAVVDREPTVHPESRQQTIQPGFPVPNPPAPVSEIRSPEPLTNFHPVSVAVDQHSQPNSNYLASVLEMLAPSEGPLSGGPTILLSGTNFPSTRTVYARFGTVVVPTV